jgi:hypothetical protein
MIGLYFTLQGKAYKKDCRVYLQRTTNISLPARNDGKEQDHQRILSIYVVAYSKLEEN